jgi:hypothetical protein
MLRGTNQANYVSINTLFFYYLGCGIYSRTTGYFELIINVRDIGKLITTTTAAATAQ